jgi:hypothetical protein
VLEAAATVAVQECVVVAAGADATIVREADAAPLVILVGNAGAVEEQVLCQAGN